MGFGVFTAGLILAVMIIPFIAAVMRDVFETTPPILKESAYGLGATTWEVVWNVVLPYTRRASLAASCWVLAGPDETMAVTFVIGNAYNISAQLFEPGNSIASALANEFNEASDPAHLSALITLGLTLFVLSFIVSQHRALMLAKLSRRRRAAHEHHTRNAAAGGASPTIRFIAAGWINRFSLAMSVGTMAFGMVFPVVDSCGVVQQGLRSGGNRHVHADDAAARLGRWSCQRDCRQPDHRRCRHLHRHTDRHPRRHLSRRGRA